METIASRGRAGICRPRLAPVAQLMISRCLSSTASLEPDLVISDSSSR